MVGMVLAEREIKRGRKNSIGERKKVEGREMKWFEIEFWVLNLKYIAFHIFQEKILILISKP